MVLKITFIRVFKTFLFQKAIERSDVILNPNNLYVTCLIFPCGEFLDLSYYPGDLNFMRKCLGLGLSYFFFFFS